MKQHRGNQQNLLLLNPPAPSATKSNTMGQNTRVDKRFRLHTDKGNQNSFIKKSSLGKPSLRDTNASGSSKYYGTLVMKRCSAARRARSMLC